jgi:hypothetical protein
MRFKDLTWFGKFLFLIFYGICCILISIAFVIAYIFYIPFVIFRWACTGKFKINNLWAMTDWQLNDCYITFNEEKETN